MSRPVLGGAAAGAVSARLDRLPRTPLLWRWVVAISLGGFFEVYDLAFTALMSPLLVRDGVFRGGSGGFFGLPDQATFAFVTMLGLYVGSLAFSAIGDRVSRKLAFTGSMGAYALATVVMGLQDSSAGINLWRGLASVALGVELVVVDCFLAEVTPKAGRGRVFALSKSLQMLAIPIGGALATFVGPHVWLGFAGWRWLAMTPGVGALLVMALRRGLPESPRWLAAHGRVDEANRVVELLEQEARHRGHVLAQPSEAAGLGAAAAPVQRGYGELLRRPHRARFFYLVIAAPASSIAFYGFAHWAPTLLEQEGAALTKSLLYAAAISLAYPLGPLLASCFADRIERKWQIAITGPLVAVLALIFSSQREPAAWIVLGFLLTLFSEINSTATHTYRSELFPTEIRARAVAFVYSFDRLATALSSYLIAAVLVHEGSPGVFAVLAASMALCTAVTLLFGPKTLGRAYEEIEDAALVRSWGSTPARS